MPSGATSVCRRSSGERQIADSIGETRTPLLNEIASVFGIIGVVAFAATLVSVGAYLQMIQGWSFLERMLTIQKATFTYRSMDITIQPTLRCHEIGGKLCVRMPVDGNSTDPNWQLG